MNRSPTLEIDKTPHCNIEFWLYYVTAKGISAIFVGIMENIFLFIEI